METRVAIVSIIVEDGEKAAELNAILHEYNRFILGRMGIPCRKHGISINSLAGRIGRLNGVTAKTVYSAKSYPADVQ